MFLQIRVLQIMQMELVASLREQVSAITYDLMYMYSIYSLSSCIHFNVDRCTVGIYYISGYRFVGERGG